MLSPYPTGFPLIEDRPIAASRQLAGKGVHTRVPILMYHEVTSKPVSGFSAYAVTPRAFRSQMRYLAWAGYSPVGLDQLCSGGSLPQRPVVITFDDGFKSCIENVMPHLEALDFRATFFLVAGLVGGSSRWLRRELGRELPLADWPTLRRLASYGVECGAHSMSHPRLTELPTATCVWELKESKRVIEEQLGREVAHLAYPYGDYNTEVQAMVLDAGYRTACSTRGGLSGTQDDRYALRRVLVSGLDSLLDFVCRLKTGRSVSQLLQERARGAWSRVVHLHALGRRSAHRESR
jgi:peptidoglycan/xylan/chitin deacetylase (PgdA/CDA1 family)